MAADWAGWVCLVGWVCLFVCSFVCFWVRDNSYKRVYKQKLVFNS